jgi:hypothetical protein
MPQISGTEVIKRFSGQASSVPYPTLSKKKWRVMPQISGTEVIKRSSGQASSVPYPTFSKKKWQSV